MAKKKKEAPITGITVSKEEDFSAWYTELINKAELADIRYNVKGFVVYREWATITIKKMYAKYEELLEKNGHLPLIMPSLIPESNFLLESQHVEGFAPEVFWVTEAGSSGELTERLALRPTSETALYKMYPLWIRSYKDLPFKRYLSCQVWRYETKMTRPFFRGREFHWIESHNVFSTMEGAMDQVKEDMEMTYQMLQDEFGIPIIFFERPQWDKFAGAVSTYAADALMGSGKVLQQPSTHLLGQNFSKPFNIKFIDKDGKEKYGYQTCYGPAISRIYGAMIAYLGDDKGLILPFDIAPVQIAIIPILYKGKEEQVLEKSREVFEKLKKKYIVKIDGSDESVGSKFYYWELKGVPLRIEIGPKDVENQQLVIVKRHDGKKFTIKEDDLINKVDELAQNYTKEIKEKSLVDFEAQIEITYEKDAAIEAINNGKIVCCGFCSIDMDAYQCAEVVEKETGGEVRGKRVDEEKHEFTTCLICGKPAGCTVYIAKSY
ncbi:MAG: proline--tRNA ligase [Promethearchaeota archaeon Loki_b32]|nr:MAG: proline--tRNA ligase [Candidatus Lokiarchaeota archaeon Loki_b32]